MGDWRDVMPAFADPSSHYGKSSRGHSGQKPNKFMSTRFSIRWNRRVIRGLKIEK